MNVLLRARRFLSRPVKTVDIYVGRIFLGAYAVCLVTFVGLFLVIETFAKLDRFLNQGAALFEVLARYYAAMIPTVYTNYLGPVLTTAAGAVTLTLLQRHNELVPLKCAGMSVYRAVVPIFFFAALLTAFTFFMQEKVLPALRVPIRTALAVSHGRPLNPEPYYDAENGLWIQIREYSTTRQLGSGVSISATHPNGLAKMQIDAKQIEWVPEPGGRPDEGRWVLHDGSIQRWDEAGNLVVNEGAKGFERLKQVFPRLELRTNLRPIDLETSDLDITYLSWQELKTQYRRQPYHRHLAVKLHHHFAFPLAHFVLLLLGLSFAAKTESRSVFVAIAGSLFIGGVFFLVNSISMSIASDSLYFSPALAAWLPIMLFGSLGVTLFDRLPT